MDAVVFAVSGYSSFGCVLRNDAGSFIAGCGGKLSGIGDPKMAEALAFREALSWLKKMQVSQVFVELDLLGVVQAFHNNQNDFSYFGSLIQDCSDIVKDLRSYSVYFVRRSNLFCKKISELSSSLSCKRS